MAQTDMHNLYLYLNGVARLQLSDQVLFLPKSSIDFMLRANNLQGICEIRASESSTRSRYILDQSDHSKVCHMYSTSYSVKITIILGIYQNTIVCMHAYMYLDFVQELCNQEFS